MVDSQRQVESQPVKLEKSGETWDFVASARYGLDVSLAAGELPLLAPIQTGSNCLI